MTFKDRLKAARKAVRDGTATQEQVNIVQKQKQKARAYRENNREKVREIKRAYYENNREKVREIKRAYYENNREKVCERSRAYYENNREKVREIQRAYYSKIVDTYYGRSARKALREKAIADTIKEIENAKQ